MKSESKTRNTARNIVYGTILKTFQIFAPFIVRTVIIKVLGLEYAGLNSLFSSILAILNIAELGVGFTLVYSMYQPIVDNDTVKICALMRLYKIYYRIIGLVIFVLGVSITPFLPNLISGEIPAGINLYIIYYLNLIATSFSYWLFAYRNSLFSAHQRNDIISKITLLTDFLKYAIQIILLYLLKNYYVFLVVALFMQLVNNVFIAIVSKKVYPDYKAYGEVERAEKERINSSIKDIFLAKIGDAITTSVDTIIISGFLGLVPLAIYHNYHYVVNALVGFFAIFYQSSRAAIGTNLIVKSGKENYSDFKLISFIAFFLITICISCLLTMYQPFILLWIGEEGLLDYYCVILFGVYLFSFELTTILGSYRESSGKWHADRFRPLITALVNLFLNIALVKYMGIHGILIATIFSYLFVNIPWLFRRVFKDILPNPCKKDYFIFIIKQSVIVGIASILSCIICSCIHISNNFILLIVFFCISSFVSISVFTIVNYKSDELYNSFRLVKSLIHR